MPVPDRLFTSDTAIIALYGDAALPSTPPTGLVNLLTVFRNCSIHGTTEKDQARATSEGVSHSIPYAKGYTIEVGSVIDTSFAPLTSLMRIYIAYGPGPFWIWIQLQPGDPTIIQHSYVTRAIIDNVHVTADGEMDSEGMTLEAIQEFQPIGATNKIG